MLQAAYLTPCVAMTHGRVWSANETSKQATKPAASAASRSAQREADKEKQTKRSSNGGHKRKRRRSTRGRAQVEKADVEKQVWDERR